MNFRLAIDIIRHLHLCSIYICVEDTIYGLAPKHYIGSFEKQEEKHDKEQNASYSFSEKS